MDVGLFGYPLCLWLQADINWDTSCGRVSASLVYRDDMRSFPSFNYNVCTDKTLIIIIPACQYSMLQVLQYTIPQEESSTATRWKGGNDKVCGESKELECYCAIVAVKKQEMQVFQLARLRLHFALLTQLWTSFDQYADLLTASYLLLLSRNSSLHASG